MIPNYETDPALLALIQRAAKRKITKTESAAQRRSWVLAEASMGSDADQRAYRRALFANDLEEMARLDAEAKARYAAASKILDESQF